MDGEASIGRVPSSLLSSLPTHTGRRSSSPAGRAAAAAAASATTTADAASNTPSRDSSGAPSPSSRTSSHHARMNSKDNDNDIAADRRALGHQSDTMGSVDALLEGSSSRSLPPSPPQRPSQLTPPFSPGSPHSHHARDHVHSGSESDFEDLVLDGRDAVIIVSVFLPIRVKLIQTAIQAKTSATPRADGTPSDFQHRRLRSLSQSSSNGDVAASVLQYY